MSEALKPEHGLPSLLHWSMVLFDETPYAGEARDRHKHGRDWVGYTVHLSETCEEGRVNLITHVQPTPAHGAEALWTAAMQRAVVDRGRAPKTHRAEGGSIAADLRVERANQRGLTWVGPVRDHTRWRQKGDGASAVEQCRIDWGALPGAVSPRPSLCWVVALCPRQ